jgi:hypothetical protein
VSAHVEALRRGLEQLLEELDQLLVVAQIRAPVGRQKPARDGPERALEPEPAGGFGNSATHRRRTLDD